MASASLSIPQATGITEAATGNPAASSASPAPKSRELATWQHRDAYHWTYPRHKNKDAPG